MPLPTNEHIKKLYDDLQVTLQKERHARYTLEQEVKVLRAQLEAQGLPDATAWLQTKVWGQRKALDALNRKVLTQRFVLRTLDDMDRGLTKAEYDLAKANANPQLEKRLLETI